MFIQFNVWKRSNVFCRIEIEKMESIAIRSREREGFKMEKKVSRYFCNLVNRKFIYKSMTFFERGNGKTTHDQTDMLTEVKKFYEKLYAHRDCKDIGLMALLPDIPTLSGEESELIESKITYAEALAALSKMKNHKGPGPAGFSVEFYFIVVVKKVRLLADL